MLTVLSECWVVEATSNDVWMRAPAAIAWSKRTGRVGEGGGGGGVAQCEGDGGTVHGEQQNVHSLNAAEDALRSPLNSAALCTPSPCARFSKMS